MNPLLRGRRREDGAAAVEFALIMLVLFYLIFGIIQYGLYFYATNAASSAAREALRRVVVGDCQTQAELDALANSQVGGAASAAPTVTRDPADWSTAAVGETVTIEVEFDAINMNFPFIPIPNSGNVVRVADGRIEDLTNDEACPS